MTTNTKADEAAPARRVAFRMVKGGKTAWMQKQAAAGIPGESPPSQAVHDCHAFILPPINATMNCRYAIECDLIGMTSAQRELVWRSACKNIERATAYISVTSRVDIAWKALEEALDQERRESLAILMEHHPKAARRIMRSYAKK